MISIMHLHQNKDIFIELIEATSDYKGIPEEFIEKDYFVSFLLKEIVELCPDIVFKGGTSLSKCYKLIDRFSEDIDINLHNSITPNERAKRNLKKSIEAAIINTELDLTNSADIKSRRDFNQYYVSFPSLVASSGSLREHLLVESYVSLKSYPCERMVVTNYILDFLKAENEIFLIDKYNLEGFEMNVQTVERTLIDKLFAICDYFERDNITQNSRHLYDIHKIWSNNSFEKSSFSNLLSQVAYDRSSKPNINISAKDGYEILRNLNEIIEKGTYKQDYEGITNSLLFSKCSYDEAVESLKEIISSNLLPDIIVQAKK